MAHAEDISKNLDIPCILRTTNAQVKKDRWKSSTRNWPKEATSRYMRVTQYGNLLLALDSAQI
jgi:phosphoenolpyruvate synthase/pyruvate phosphate dikinase